MEFTFAFHCEKLRFFFSLSLVFSREVCPKYSQSYKNIALHSPAKRNNGFEKEFNLDFATVFISCNMPA